MFSPTSFKFVSFFPTSTFNVSIFETAPFFDQNLIQRNSKGVKLISNMQCILWLTLLACTFTLTFSRCSYCSYVAHNCTDDASIPGVPVCDATSRLQQDDVFCDDDDCTCAENFSCVSLEMGCQNLMVHKPTRRCISPSSIAHRFTTCSSQMASPPLLSNVDGSWVNFNNVSCKSDECQATRSFSECRNNGVECGHLITVWKDASMYHFVIDGSRSDMTPGDFHFKGVYNKQLKTIDCESITNEAVHNCYTLQSRNTKEGKCTGVYLQKDLLLETQSVSDLSWPVLIGVIGSIIGAVVMVCLALYVYFKMGKKTEGEQEMEPFNDDFPAELRHRAASPQGKVATS